MEVVAPETVGLSRTRLDKLTAWMDDQVASNRLAGLSTMIRRQGKAPISIARAKWMWRRENQSQRTPFTESIP